MKYIVTWMVSAEVEADDEQAALEQAYEFTREERDLEASAFDFEAEEASWLE